VNRKSSNIRAPEPILGGFVPINVLWDGGAKPALFLSETSARWFIRTNRAELVEAKALARFGARTLIHQERFEEVAQRVALRNFAGTAQGAAA
jgi:hypothetical protein